MFSVVELGTRTPPWKRASRPASASSLHVAAHRLQRDAEALGQRLDRDRAARRAPLRAAAAWRGFGVIAAERSASRWRRVRGMPRRAPSRYSRLRLDRSEAKTKTEERRRNETNSRGDERRRPLVDPRRPVALAGHAARAAADRRSAARRLRRARRRRRHQRRRHRARPRRPRRERRAVREGRPGVAHLVVVDQADPRRPALPRVLRVLAGAQGAGRARGAAAERAAHHVAAALRDAARPVDAAGVDDPHRPVPLRPPGAARGPAGLAHRRPAPPSGRRAAEAGVHARASSTPTAGSTTRDWWC